MYEYWIGRGVDYQAVWSAYEDGEVYIRKYRTMRVHLFRMTLQEQPSELPLFNFEAVYKTVKGYFHDLKQGCLNPDEYETAGPLFIYSVNRGSGVWDFLGELRQLLMLGTTLADEKVMGQKIENMDKRVEFIRKHFGTVISPKDFERFMKAKTPKQLDSAVQKLIRQGIKRIQISSEPFAGDMKATETSLVDIKTPD
ncbi:MAG: hypothetical protein WCB27_04370 [Thermoguttaceae bacterium]